MCRWPRLESWRGVLVLLLGLFALQQGAGAAVIKGKAWLAPLLIERAWQKTLEQGGTANKPWPWADTWPVARLRVPALEVDLLVLAGARGNALAFGPGHAGASPVPGSRGQSVIAGHRDTHFAFLREVSLGDHVQLQLPDGGVRSYAIQTSRVVDSDIHQLTAAESLESLLLVTCYPFNALRAGGSLRYVVYATPTVFPPQKNTNIGSKLPGFSL